MSASLQKYDEKNQQDYDENTDLINVGLDRISSDINLKPTIAQLSQITGLHRNTLNNRSFPKERLRKIKQKRKVYSELKKVEKKDAVKELEDQLDNAKVELIHWFTKFHALELNFQQLQIKTSRTKESLDFHKKDLIEEQEKSKFLNEELNRLKYLIGQEK